MDEDIYIGWIYMIINKINNKIYVGQTINKNGYKKRWNQHKNELRKNSHHNIFLQNSWNKYGEENFEFILLHELIFNTEEERKKILNLIEKIYIIGWNLLDDRYGYNIAEGGSDGNPLYGKSVEELELINLKNSISTKIWWSSLNKEEYENMCRILSENSTWWGRKHTEESKKKISDGVKNWNNNLSESDKKIRSDKLSILNSGDKNGMYGKHHSNKTKEEMSKIRKKWWNDLDENESNLMKQKLKDGHKEYWNNISDEDYDRFCKSRSGELHPMYGKHHSEETKNKISLANRNNSYNVKKVAMINIDDNNILKIFESFADANEYMGKNRSDHNINDCARGKHDIAWGYKWRYLDNELNVKYTEYDLYKNKVAMIDKKNNEIIKLFNSIVDANVYLNKNKKDTNIGKCLNGKSKSAWGYKWEWIKLDINNNIIRGEI